MKSEPGLGLAVHWVQKDLVLAYENNCPLKPVKAGRQTLKWTKELESLRKKLDGFLISADRIRIHIVGTSFERLSRLIGKRCGRPLKVLGGPSVAPLKTYLGRLDSIGLFLGTLKLSRGSLVTPSGSRTQSEGETLELLLTTHFPNSGVTQESATPAAVLLARRPDWRLPMKVVTYRRVEWAIDSFAPYKSPGADGTFPALLQLAREIVIPRLVRIFRACLSTGYVPAIWRQVKVVFIPKPGKDSYSGPRDYRPISPTSFLLKTMERLVDRHLRDDLAFTPLHSNQHAYQAGKSVETVLHQLVVRVGKALD